MSSRSPATAKTSLPAVPRADVDPTVPVAALKLAIENMDQGVLLVDAQNKVVFFNGRLVDLLGLDSVILFPGAAMENVRAELQQRGEYDQADPISAAWGRTAAIEREPAVSERRRPNGTLLEIRAMPLPDGGVVRTFTDITLRRALEEKARSDRERYKLLAEHSGDVVIWGALDSTRRYVSPAVKATLGYEPDELVGTKPLDFIHPDDVEHYAAVLDDLSTGRAETATTRQRYRHKAGRYVWIEASFNLIRDPANGAATGWVAALRDVGERVAAEEALRVSEQRLALALQTGGDGIWEYDLRSGMVSFTGRWLSLLGFDDLRSPIGHDDWRRLTHPDDLDRIRTAIADHLAGRSLSLDCEYRVRRKSGGHLWNHVRGRIVEWDAHGTPVRLIGTNADVTERKEAEALVSHLALHDSLTGLANRTLYLDRLGQALRDHEGAVGGTAVLACDLDRFKAVNDILGHQAGDRVLRGAAQRLAAIVGETGIVARLGGDEFGIVLDQLEEPREAATLAWRIVEAMTEPFIINERPVAVGISLGICSIAPGEATPAAEDIHGRADIALYKAKGEGGTFRFFEDAMGVAVAARTQLEEDLREAVRRNAFVLNFQPFIDLATAEVRGFEALLRWPHPTRGLVTPSEFVPLAEETGLVVPIGSWVLAEACRQAMSWAGDLRVAVNVSLVQFRQPAALQQVVVSALASSGLPARRLELEVTESVLAQDAEAVVSCLRGLRDIGVGVALDDFGTGYSSLAYLRRFPFSKIKLDRSFVEDIADPWTAAIISAVVGLAGRVEADVTAEGVETVDQLSRVRALGCSQVQGFLLSCPLPPAEARSFIDAWSPEARLNERRLDELRSAGSTTREIITGRALCHRQALAWKH